MLLEIEEFAYLNRMYELRDRISLSYDALVKDVAQGAQPNVQTGLQWKAERSISSGDFPFGVGNVLQFPIGARNSRTFDTAFLQANNEQD